MRAGRVRVCAAGPGPSAGKDATWGAGAGQDAQVPLVTDFLWEGETVIRRVRVGPTGCRLPGPSESGPDEGSLGEGQERCWVTSLCLSFLM